jgi:hypothetical protein
MCACHRAEGFAEIVRDRHGYTDLRPEGTRQIGGRDPFTLAENHGVLDDVVELTHVALPGKCQEHLHGGAFHPLEGLLELAVVQTHEMLDERRNVLAALAKRRDLHADDVQPIKEIVAEAPFLHCLVEALIRGGDDAHLHFDRVARADGKDLLLLDRTQELHLQVERQVADLVEEDRAAAGALEKPLLVVDRARERTTQMAEQLAFQEILGDGSAVHGQSAVAGLAEVVDRARDHSLHSRFRP